MGVYVSILDRLLHHSEILTIEGDSFRLKEATEKNIERKAKRSKAKKLVIDEVKNNA